LASLIVLKKSADHERKVEEYVEGSFLKWKHLTKLASRFLFFEMNDLEVQREIHGKIDDVTANDLLTSLITRVKNQLVHICFYNGSVRIDVPDEPYLLTPTLFVEMYRPIELERFKALLVLKDAFLREIKPLVEDEEYQRILGGIEELEIGRFFQSESEKRDNLLEKIESLDLSLAGIFYVPEEIELFKNLKRLDLSHNNLQSLPDSFSKLSKLEYLRMANNDFIEIPDCIYSLLSLKNLNMSINKLTVIKSDIERLGCLEELNVSDNKLDRFPSNLGYLSSLRKVIVTNNNITSIPTSVERNEFIEVIN
jgi:hypothetical protein